MMLAAEVRVAVGAEEVEDAAVLVGMVIAVVVPPDNGPTPPPWTNYLARDFACQSSPSNSYFNLLFY